MAKGVLGNDPFLRGAAPRTKEPVPPAGAKPAAPAIKAKPASPKNGRSAGRPEARVKPSRPPTAHAASPELVADVDARPPTAHPASPELVANLAERRPTAHPASPELVANLAERRPTAHAASPELVANVTAEPPTAHAASPELVANVTAEPPTAHAASPELVANVAAEPPTPHAASPELLGVKARVAPSEVVLRPPTPHAGSPELLAAEPAPERSGYERAESAAAEAVQNAGSEAPLPAATLRSNAAGTIGALREVASQVVDSSLVSRTLSAADGLWRAASSAIGVAASVDLDDYGRDATLVRALQPVFDFFYDRYWRVQVEGADNLPDGPVLLVANHSGALPFDGPMVAQALSRERADLREARWLLEDQVFHAPFLGTLSNRLGAVRACPDNALRLLAEGRPLVVFPEGVQGIGKTYKERYRLKRFGRGGFVKIALRSGAPIIPVAVVGAEEAMPVLYKLPGNLFGVPYLPVTPLGPVPLPARWTIRFGEPIDLAGAAAADEHDLPRVQRLTERTRESIQQMLTQLLQMRSGVF